MPIPAGGYPLTAAVSPRVQVAAQTDSTNADVIAAIGADPGGWPHLSLLLTRDQRAGRGRLDRSWTAPPETSIAVSVAVFVGGIPIASRGWISLVAGAAMTRAVSEQVRGSGHSAGLKWPNDVLLDGAKVCGILAEAVASHPDAVVIGAGVNTTMTQADLPVPTATSFAAAGLVADEDRLLADYVRALGEQLAALEAAHGDAAAAGVLGEIEALCTTVGSGVRVALPDGTTLEGRAQRLDRDGRLVVVDHAGASVSVAAGDVVHVR